MNVEIRVPMLPESVQDATLVAWRKQPGDAVGRDENLADLETDKVVLEVPSPVAGVLQEIRAQAGTTVRNGELLAVIAAGEASAATSAATPATAKPTSAERPEPVAPRSAPAPQVAAATAAAPKMGPAAQRVADELGLAPSTIAAAAKSGRVAKSDLVAAAAAAGDANKVDGKAAPVPAPASAPAPVSRPATPGERSERRVPMSRIRRRIAERLVEAQSTQALLTTFNEVDLTNINELRKRHKEAFEQRHGVKLGIMSFFVKAAIAALKAYPVLNAAVEGTDIVYHDYYDIGVAVSTDRGLMVPVLRDADSLDFAAVERAIADYAQRARSGSIAIEELSGGTFSLTNGGVFGSLLSTPIVNAPQSAILGMHKSQLRPVVVDGQVVPRPMMYLALSYDHRIIDGREAVQFLVAAKESLEDPGRMLLGV